ncbi:MAG: ABC transporter permease [Tannerellaceae bacterium]|jgi:ABC-2 type transport system permease protein|nr:ABC transporter permease [Tannerellaceae bacterium]
MKQFISFVNKEFRHIFRDKRTMLLLLGMPVVQMILFGFAITTEVRNINICTPQTWNYDPQIRIMEGFAANPYFNITGTIGNSQEIDEVFREGKADLVIVLDAQRTNPAIQLIADATDPNTAITEVAYATRIIHEAQQVAVTAIPQGQIIPNVRMLYNPQMKSAYNFVPGVMGLILMLICAMMTSISIVREKEMGTMELLLVSPVKPFSIILSKAVPYFVISTANMLIIILLAVYLLHVPLVGSMIWLSIISWIYILVCLSLGLLISTVAQTQVAAMLISGVMLMMPALLLSGMIYPVENMPAILEGVSCIIPARWYIAAVKKLMIQGLEITYVAKEVAILLLMASFLLTVSLKKFSLRLQ